MQTRPIGRIPAIVFIHGGPDDHVDPLYLSTVQFLAKRGFIIVVPIDVTGYRASANFAKKRLPAVSRARHNWNIKTDPISSSEG